MKKVNGVKTTPRPPALKELQTWMRWVLTDPRGVGPALGNEMSASRLESVSDPALLSRYIEPEYRALYFIESTEANDQTEKISRLNVYAEGYFSRLLESLSLDFSKTRKLLGDEFFSKLIGDYLKANPSRSKNIGDVGEKLPEYSENHFLSEINPWLPDLIMLERNETLAFFGGHSEKFDPAQFSQLTEENLPDLKIKLHPSIRLQASDFRLSEVDELQAGQDLEEENSFFVIYRAEHLDDQVKIKVVSETEFDIIEGCLENKHLFDLFTDKEGKIETEMEVAALFSRWIEHGWISSLAWDGKTI